MNGAKPDTVALRNVRRSEVNQQNGSEGGEVNEFRGKGHSFSEGVGPPSPFHNLSFCELPSLESMMPTD